MNAASVKPTLIVGAIRLVGKGLATALCIESHSGVSICDWVDGSSRMTSTLTWS